MIPLPRMFAVRQRFPRPRVDDVADETVRQLASLGLNRQVRPGETVAITAGSRGIANIAVILKAIVDYFHAIGANPFLVPAMGSHGGATAEGQLAVLASFGLTPESMGCEIRSSMEVIVIDRTPHGLPVHFDRQASMADHVMVVNRVKPHTGFVGDIESGLHKMMLIGLGKHAGALAYHRAIKDFSFDEIIHAVAASVLSKGRILAGLAIVENAYDETALIEAVAPDRFRRREPELLLFARENLPRLPFPACDLLIVDQIGKNISGTGMDTNVVGRKFIDHSATTDDLADCRRIFVRGLTLETKGQASGIGIAEFTNRRTADAIDFPATYVNCITAGHPAAGMLPMVYDTDREAIEQALQTIGQTLPEAARVIQITDTLHLSEVLVSEAFAADIAGAAHLELVTPSPMPMTFDSSGSLADVRDAFSTGSESSVKP